MKRNQNNIKKIGLIVNPIAGMGGSVGLKGTDGGAHLEAIKLGATPITPKRMAQLLSHLKRKEDIFLLVAPGKMGEDLVKEEQVNYKVIGEIGDNTTAEDTKKLARMMVEENVDLLVFCGGDGTARDIFDAIGLEKPVIAIPSGVKMFSSIFMLNPRAAAEMLEAFLDGTEILEKEVLDIDEDSFRKGVLKSRLHGYLNVPKIERLIQGGKESSKTGKTIEENKNDIATHIIENMKDDTLYLLGPGTTVKAISDNLDLAKALLGIDAICNRKLIGTDINENGILELLNQHEKVKIIVSPIGGQGFILGRGNKQFTPKVIKEIGKENIIVISTEDKINGLQCLRIDTGDTDLDQKMIGHAKVITGYKEFLIIDITS